MRRDEPITHHRGTKITTKGDIYHNLVYSNKSFFVKTSDLRWICMSLLASIPWAKQLTIREKHMIT